jgi:hypothetical protein
MALYKKALINGFQYARFGRSQKLFRIVALHPKRSVCVRRSRRTALIPLFRDSNQEKSPVRVCHTTDVKKELAAAPVVSII